MQSLFGGQLRQHGDTEHVVVRSHAIHGQTGRSATGICQRSEHMPHSRCLSSLRGRMGKERMPRSTFLLNCPARLFATNLRNDVPVAIQQTPPSLSSAVMWACWKTSNTTCGTAALAKSSAALVRICNNSTNQSDPGCGCICVCFWRHCALLIITQNVKRVEGALFFRCHDLVHLALLGQILLLCDRHRCQRFILRTCIASIFFVDWSKYYLSMYHVNWMLILTGKVVLPLEAECLKTFQVRFEVLRLRLSPWVSGFLFAFGKSRGFFTSAMVTIRSETNSNDFGVVFGINWQIRIRFSSSRKLFFKTIRIFGVFKVQSHTMWP